MSGSETEQLSRRQLFDRDGFVVERGLYAADEMLEWKERAVGKIHELGVLEKEGTSGVKVFRPDALDPFFMSRMMDDHVVPILTEIIGPDVEFLSVKSVYKNQATTFGSPWHQDWHYWEGATKVSVWIALDDATAENGCLRMIPRSHTQLYKIKQVREPNGFVLRTEDSEFGGMPEVTLEVSRGDVVFFHDQVLHSSHPNFSGEDRWCMISTYRDASVVDPSKAWDQGVVVSGSSVNPTGVA